MIKISIKKSTSRRTSRPSRDDIAWQFLNEKYQEVQEITEKFETFFLDQVETPFATKILNLD